MENIVGVKNLMRQFKSVRHATPAHPTAWTRAPVTAFTLIEVLVAIALLGIVTAAMTLTMGVTLQTAEEAIVKQLAEGLAQDLMDEILNCRYSEPGISPYGPLGPAPSERAPGNRSLFDDIDDYADYVEEPPRDKWGQLLGEENGNGELRPAIARAVGLDKFRREVKVQYVSSTDFAQALPPGFVSDYRRVEVSVYWRTTRGQLRPMAKLVRVVGHIPSENW